MPPLTECWAPPLVCLCVITLNEEQNIRECLASACECGIRSAFVLDTGSTDRTCTIASSVGLDLGMYVVTAVKEFPRPVDFSAMRNTCLELARRSSAADYIFWMDADDRVHGKVPKILTEPCYNIPCAMGPTKWHRPHLLDRNCPGEFRMPRHEAFTAVPTVTLPDLCVMVSEERRHNNRSSYDDAVVLIDYFRSHPEPRVAFYIAQSFKDAGCRDSAIRWYTRRLTMGGGSEDERYYSWLMLAGLDEERREWLLQQAISTNFYRLEAYRWLAEHYWCRGAFVEFDQVVRGGMRQLNNPSSGQGMFVDESARAILQEYARKVSPHEITPDDRIDLGDRVSPNPTPGSSSR